MAGGNWSGQNKVRPGVYINFKSSASPVISPGTRGTVAIPRPMSWGPVAQVMELRPGDDLRPFTGYASTEPQTLFLREMMKGTNITSPPTKVLLYRPAAAGAAPATAELSARTDTLEGMSKFPGTIGNTMEISCAASGEQWELRITVDGTELERHTVSTAALNSDWLSISGSMPLAPFHAALAGGADGADAAAASAEPVAGLTAAAVYKGTVGNKLAIGCAGTAAPFEITVTLDGTEVDKQTVASLSDFSSKWVTLEGDGAALAAFEATPLTGGADGSSTAASAILLSQTAGVTITAAYPGTRGNDISVVIAADVDSTGGFLLSTLVEGVTVDTQAVADITDFRPNGWITLSGPGPLTATAGIRLSGGADGTVQPSAWAAALEALEPYTFDILAYDGTDDTVRAAMIEFVKRISAQEGRYAQLVTSGASGADSPFVINNVSGVVLDDGTTLTPEQVVWWLAGAQAWAQYNQALSCAAYPGAVDVRSHMTNSEIERAILAGNIVLAEGFGQVRIETDINTLTTYTPDTGEVFHKNRTMRVCGSLANDLYREFSLHFLGKVNNDEAGRGLFKAAVLDYLLTMYSRGALRERPSGDDVTVEQGSSIDSIVITVALSIADSVEKVYMTISVS